MFPFPSCYIHSVVGIYHIRGSRRAVICICLCVQLDVRSLPDTPEQVETLQAKTRPGRHADTISMS